MGQPISRCRATRQLSYFSSAVYISSTTDTVAVADTGSAAGRDAIDGAGSAAVADNTVPSSALKSK